MIKIAICDDNKEFVEYSKKIIKSIETDELTKIDCYINSSIFLESIHKIHYNIIFLDIYMPEVNGFVIAKQLNKITEKTIIIFVSSHDNAAINGYEYNAFRFLRKSTFEQDIKKVLYDSINRINDWKKTLNLKYKSNFYNLNLTDIFYIVSINNYMTIKYNNKDLKFRTPLSSISEKLLKSSFAIANRGIIVNCNHVVNLDMEKKIVFLDNSEHIKISKLGIENIKNKLLESE